MKIVLISTDESNMGAGIRVLSSCLMTNGFSTVLVLLNTQAKTLKTIDWTMLEKLCSGASLIGISCMTHGVNKAIEVRRRLGRYSCPIIVGGIHATLDPESLMGEFEYICQGDGEDLIVEAAKRIESGLPLRDIPGLIACSNGVQNKCACRKLSKDLNEYPYPDYDMTHQYTLERGKIVKIRNLMPHIQLERFVVMGSRGCPHNCSYCCNHKIKEMFPWKAQVSHYSTNYLIGHLKKICKELPEIRSFWIDDDTFFAKKLDDIKQFAKAYKEDIKMPFMILISPWTYDETKVETLVDAGLDRIIMGVQTGSEQTAANLYNRRITTTKLKNIIHSMQKFSDRLALCYDFIGMNPFETDSDLVKTIELIKSIPPPFYIYNNNLAFYPGTDLYAMAVKRGLDISLRVKHSDSKIGYAVLAHEKIRHKLLHLGLLLMAGDVTKSRVGRIPRIVLISPLVHTVCILSRYLGFLLNKLVAFGCVLILMFKAAVGRECSY